MNVTSLWCSLTYVRVWVNWSEIHLYGRKTCRNEEQQKINTKRGNLQITINWKCICNSFTCCLSASNTLSIIRPVTGSLSGKVNLPCFFSTIPTSAPAISPNGTVYSKDYLRIKWTKIEGEVESTVLVAQNGLIKIGSSYRNRVSVPSHPEDVGDASLTMVKLRASDAGTYRCEVMYGIDDTQDTVNLDVNGKRFPVSY